MPPLTRLDTRPSIHSWWPDSNSPLAHSPTINLHAAVKPLMKLMYHRQALALIKKNRGKPLSETTLEIYMSYFKWDFVSSSTKAEILFELAKRAATVDEARVVVDSPDFSYITQTLKSPDVKARISSCRLLGSLARHECTTGAILELETCTQLVSMLRDEDSGVVNGAVLALSRIALTFDGVEAIVDAGTLDHVAKLLESPSHNIRQCTCKLVGKLASHDSTRAAVLALKPHKQLVALLRDEDHEVIEWAVYTLHHIAFASDGAQAIVDAGVLNVAVELLESPSSNIRAWTCLLVGNLASHEFSRSRAAILALQLNKRLVALLGDENPGVVDGAVLALQHIALSFDDAQAIVDAGALDHVRIISYSPEMHVISSRI